MKPLLKKLSTWADTRSLPERAVLLLIALALTYVALDTLLLSPVAQKQNTTRAQIQHARNEILRLRQETEKITAEAQNQTRLDTIQRHRALKEQVGQLSQRIRLLAPELVSPREMTRALKTVLQNEGGLQLVRLENLPATPYVQPTAAGGVSLYQHGIVLEFQGGFFDTWRYLKRLEQGDWKLVWDSLNYKVTAYPTADVTVSLHTLSTEKGWVGD